MTSRTEDGFGCLGLVMAFLTVVLLGIPLMDYAVTFWTHCGEFNLCRKFAEVFPWLIRK